jgi:hypothetical protein
LPNPKLDKCDGVAQSIVGRAGTYDQINETNKEEMEQIRKRRRRRRSWMLQAGRQAGRQAG